MNIMHFAKNVWRKPLALFMVLMMVALVLPMMALSVRAAVVTIEAADLNSGVVSRTDYGAGDTVVITDTAGGGITLAGWQMIRNFATPLNLVLDNTITAIPGDYDTVLSRFSALLSVRGPAVLTIGQNAFTGCDRLTAVDFPNVVTVEQWAFFNCCALTDVNFPKATTLGRASFYFCQQLQSVSIPMVSMIDIKAFEGCTALRSMYLPSVMPTIGDKAFVGVPQGLVVYVDEPGDPSYNGIANIVKGAEILKKEHPSYSPATPDGVGGGLIGSNAKTVEKSIAEEEQSLGNGIVTVRRLNVRLTPDTGHPPLGRLSRGTVVEILDIENEFAKIIFNGEFAYISIQHLSLDFEMAK